MEPTTCRWCGTEIGEGLDKCPSCGARPAPVRSEAAASSLPPAPAWSAAQPAVVAAAPALAAVPQTPLPVPAAPPPGLVVASTTWTPVAVERQGGLHPLVWVVGLLLAAALGFVGLRLVGGPLVSFPDTILGEPKMSGPAVDEVVRTLEDTKIAGQSFRAAFYGSTAPALMIVVSDSSSLEDPEQTWTGFGGGFAATSGTTIDDRSRVMQTIDGVNYICATVSGMPATVCQWTDDRTTGYVFDYATADARVSVTRTGTVRDAVVND